MKLLIDVGNTRLKWAAWQDGKRSVGGVFPHRQITLEQGVGNNWKALMRPRAVVIASVVDARLEEALADLVRVRFKLEAQFVRTPARALGIVSSYAIPEQFGIDRFLALAALHQRCAQVQVLASCGTALTLDAIDAEGRHLGGLIAPSPTLMRQALWQGTARLKDVPGELVDSANNTADAVYSGCLLAAVALIVRFREHIGQQTGIKPALFGDGGGIADCLDLLPDAQRERDLVMRGLALWPAPGD